MRQVPTHAVAEKAITQVIPHNEWPLGNLMPRRVGAVMLLSAATSPLGWARRSCSAPLPCTSTCCCSASAWLAAAGPAAGGPAALLAATGGARTAAAVVLA